MSSIRRIRMLILAPTLVASMFLFISCGSERGVKNDNDMFSDLDKGSSDGNSDEAASNDSSDDATASSGGISRFTGNRSTAAKEEEEAKNVDPTVLSENKGSADTSDQSAASLEASAPEANNTPAPAATPEAPVMVESKDASKATSLDPNPEKASDQSPAPQLMTGLMAGNDISTAATPSAKEATVTNDVQVAPKAEKPVAANKHSKKSSGNMRTPSLPAESIWKKGQSLNRYYFLRGGDTPASVAMTVYGDSAKANNLADWNGEEWAAGKVVYYASPDQPTDGMMKSLFEDREIPPASYTVKKGDHIKDIAKATYGNEMSWTEIAAMNKLHSPSHLAVGQQLALYPMQVPARIVPVAVAEKPPAPVVAKQDMVPAAAPVANAAPKVMPKNGVKFPATDEELASPEDVGSFFEEHLVGVIAGIVLIFAGFIIYSRTKKSRDFLD